MNLIEEMSALGADTEDALTRFMGNSGLYERMLKKFPKVVADSPVATYARSEDFDTAASNAHALKGVTGNLSLTPLYNNYTALIDLYHEGKSDQANELLDKTLEIQQKFLDTIAKYI